MDLDYETAKNLRDSSESICFTFYFEDLNLGTRLIIARFFSSRSLPKATFIVLEVVLFMFAVFQSFVGILSLNELREQNSGVDYS